MASRVVIGIVLFSIAIYYIREYFQGGVCHSDKRLDGKTVVITGANIGIGKETAIDLASRGARVVIGCRDLKRGHTAIQDIKERSGNDEVFAKYLNLASLNSVRKFAQTIINNEERVDILINNAGVMWYPFEITEDGFEMQFGVNHLGHFLLTRLLLEKLKHSAPSRIVTLTSTAHERVSSVHFSEGWKKDNYSRITSYASSKLANLLFSRELAKVLQGTGVTTYAVHPGVTMTELTRHIPGIDYLKILLWPVTQVVLKSPKQGAQTSICCAVADEFAGQSGLYYADCKVKRPSREAQDPEAARKLWTLSVHWTT